MRHCCSIALECSGQSFVVRCATFSALLHIVLAFISDPPLYSYTSHHKCPRALQFSKQHSPFTPLCVLESLSPCAPDASAHRPRCRCRCCTLLPISLRLDFFPHIIAGVGLCHSRQHPVYHLQRNPGGRERTICLDTFFLPLQVSKKNLPVQFKCQRPMPLSQSDSFSFDTLWFGSKCCDYQPGLLAMIALFQIHCLLS